MHVKNAVNTERTIVVHGTGSIGMRHLRVFRDLASELVIAVPKRPERCEDLRHEGFSSVASMSDAAVPDALLVIASDTGRHIRDAVDAMALGFAGLLIEKPLAPSVQGLRELEMACSRIPNKIFVACNLRFAASMSVFRNRLAEIGRIHHVRIEAQSYLPEWRPERDYRQSYSADAAQGGVLRDLIHEIDYAVWLFGRPGNVYAMLSNTGRLGIASEESADLLWQVPSGPTVSMRLDYLTRQYRRIMTATGKLGEIIWDFPTQTVTLRKVGCPPEVIVTPQARDEMMHSQAVAFLSACQTGAQSQLATLEEGAFAVALCDAARTSSETGKRQTIPDWRKQ